MGPNKRKSMNYRLSILTNVIENLTFLQGKGKEEEKGKRRGRAEGNQGEQKAE